MELNHITAAVDGSVQIHPLTPKRVSVYRLLAAA
jgi:hypothetical protein